MGDSDSPAVSVSLSGPTDIPAVLNRAGIDHVSVHDHRLLAIYQTAIFNVTTGPQEISNAHTLEIECWETPILSHADERSKQELIRDFTGVFDSVEDN